MRLKTILILVLIFFIGCSSKINKFYKNKKIHLTSKELQQVNDININKYGKFLFYAYLKDGLILTKVSKQLLETKNNEEVIKVYENSYYPNYKLLRNRKESLCGKNFIDDYNQINYNFCKSHYLSNAYMSETIADEVAGAIATLGIYNLATRDKHLAKFNYDRFKRSIVKSKLPKFKTLISEKLLKKSIFIVIEPTPHELKDNIIKISSLEKEISGLILSDKNHNIYDIIDISSLKHEDLFSSVSKLTEKIVNSYLKPNKFLVEDFESNIILTKDEKEKSKHQVKYA